MNVARRGPLGCRVGERKVLRTEVRRLYACKCIFCKYVFPPDLSDSERALRRTSFNEQTVKAGHPPEIHLTPSCTLGERSMCHYKIYSCEEYAIFLLENCSVLGSTTCGASSQNKSFRDYLLFNILPASRSASFFFRSSRLSALPLPRTTAICAFTSLPAVYTSSGIIVKPFLASSPASVTISF